MFKITRKFRRIALIVLAVAIIPGGVIVAADMMSLSRRMFMDNGEYNANMVQSSAFRLAFQECVYKAFPIQFNMSDKPLPREYFLMTEKKKEKVTRCLREKGYRDLDFSQCSVPVSDGGPAFDRAYKEMEAAYQHLADTKQALRDYRERLKAGEVVDFEGDGRVPLRSLPSVASNHGSAASAPLIAPQVEVFKFKKKVEQEKTGQ